MGNSEVCLELGCNKLSMCRVCGKCCEHHEEDLDENGRSGL